MMTELATVAILTAIVSLSLPLVLIPALRSLGAHDDASARSSHTGRALRGLGISVLTAFVLGSTVAVASFAQVEALIVFACLGAATAVGLLGLEEDLRGVAVRYRFGGQLVVGLGFSVAIVYVLEVPLWWAVLGGFGFAAYSNVVNFMDGIDGITSGHALVVGLSYAAVGVIWFEPWMTVLGVTLAAAFGGFLPWNLLRKGTFLGDSGAYFLGGVIAVMAFAALVSGVPLLALVAPLAIYLADTATTLVLRMSRAEPWLSSHRSHVYQRLTARGLSHQSVAAMVSAISLLAAGAGIAGASGQGIWPSLAALGVAAIVFFYLATPRFLGSRPPFRPPLAPPISTLPLGANPAQRGMVVVVGGSGFIGSHMLRHLAEDGWSPVAVTAPRLEFSETDRSRSVNSIVSSREEEIEMLRRSFGGAVLVVNAAGLAAPNAADSDALWGANALLPALVAVAAERAGVARYIHLSSAAVQGRRPVLDESIETNPFSPYSASKAFGESVLLELAAKDTPNSPETIIVRATSVQGLERSTTEKLRRIASSRWASVASPGDRPTVVSSVTGLIGFVGRIACHPGDVPTIVLQPWEGMSAAEVLSVAGGREPRKIPASLARLAISCGYIASGFVGRLSGTVRRVELMWFGQAQVTSYDFGASPARSLSLEAVLRGDE